MLTDKDESLPQPVTSAPPATFKSKTRKCLKAFSTTIHEEFFTRKGLLGDVDYKTLITPTIPFTKYSENTLPFFGLNAKLPVVLTIILGLQHAAAMLGGLVSAPLVLAGICNLNDKDTEYVISVALLGAGILTLVQVAQIRIPYTQYRIGTGMISVLGPAFTSINVMSSVVPVMYKSGYCPTAADGTQLPCPRAYGALLAGNSLMAIAQVLTGFVPTRTMNRILPPIVTGPVVLLIGASLMYSGVQNWGGGTDCYSGGLCNKAVPSHAHPWGSGQWIGLGFSVIVGILVVEKLGPPIMKSCSIVIGLIIGCVIAAGTGYFDHKSIDAAPSGQFLWVRRFPLHLYGPLILPILSIHIVTVMENIGDITATADVSQVEVEGPEFDQRIAGGNLATGLANVVGGLMTITPLCTFSQNNGVIAMTQVASRRAGYSCCIWLIILGVIGKFSAAINAIPRAIIGGMTVMLFTSVAVAGLAIVSKSMFNRRDRLIITIGLMFGFASLLLPDWFSDVITYHGDNKAKQGFIEAVVIFVETPYAIAGLAGVLAHLIYPETRETVETLEEGVVDQESADQVKTYEL